MKDTFFLILVIFFLGCCQDDDMQPMPREVACENIDCSIEDEFYSSGLLNSECWSTNTLGISPLSADNLSIGIGDSEVNGIRGELIFDISKSTVNLQDTIWLFGQLSNNSSNSATAQYIYWEGHTPVGRFTFAPNASFTNTNYILVDNYNADTSILTGRFQLRFTERNISGFVTHAPDSMTINCGSFRVSKF